MSINLYQKRAHLEPILNNVFQDAEGNAVYTCHTPHTISPHRTTTISRSLSNNSEKCDRFEYVAQIDWRTIRSSKIRFADGKEIEIDKYIRKDGWSLMSGTGRNYTFTGKDGKDYTWRNSTLHLKLFPKDDSENPVAEFRRETLMKGGHLEVYPSAQHLLEEIIVTFIYVEQENVEATMDAAGG
ncbi:hypothetical protein F5878DRAFT_607119 [Lentinula raphanica]|uniref:DUF6593 domain-containing protein n=1 Tax=Lentinula raphanica TaxID=153919 RepID=A0AA38PGS8_9AGAR|nr:hypothetical protein F5878DRAFT_607119 [Lentinula raphanica]